MNVTRSIFLEPVILALPDSVHDALIHCAKGETLPEIALMQLLVVSSSEAESERALGAAIWKALEDRDLTKAERLGAMQKLWDCARDAACAALPATGLGFPKAVPWRQY